MVKINNSIKLVGILILFILALGLIGCSIPSNENKFQSVEGNSICKLDGKPIIRMYSTNVCPHCVWVKPAFDKLMKKDVDENKIVAYHWEWTIQDGELIGADDLLTPLNEGSIPANEEAVFNQFSPNSGVPAFVFGCKYYRLGNQFENQKDLESEEKEFVRIIEELLRE